MLKYLLCILFFSQYCFSEQHQNDVCEGKTILVSQILEKIEALQEKSLEEFYSQPVFSYEDSQNYYRLLGRLHAYDEIREILRE